MKEMTIEQKAKAYDKAIEHARSLLKTIGNATLGNLVLKNEFETMFPELKESEDEKIRKALIEAIRNNYTLTGYINHIPTKDVLAWLEKQGEHANFRNKIQIGDKVTRNEDGVLVNLSQLNRVAKKQGEQKPWSEEDEKMWSQVINEIEAIKFNSSTLFERNIAQDKIEWLKSLKDRYTWKPSNEQMEGIECTIKTLRYQLNAGDNRLDSLYNDLKKLKGE